MSHLDAILKLQISSAINTRADIILRWNGVTEKEFDDNCYAVFQYLLSSDADLDDIRLQSCILIAQRSNWWLISLFLDKLQGRRRSPASSVYP